jgi:hypothetical protein
VSSAAAAPIVEKPTATHIARPYGLLVLTLRSDQISAITWFADSSVFPHFGLPRTLRARGR